ncbi:lyase family protein [Leisingera methylohalidivorans]|uniref:3-carboxy-cis,cis-muconate cycloisomerase n=1 Tax=Leisingera methylohalidivorans DSM 14336 TaxID=999552 RepID=V9VM67_9RHOB|nr:lyase family protein [Leisingera methylohalidivorans]AHC99670.1 3-carboxy-cis,cis-muconate cycloisomerase [Leisingera methylohalidivorans DSM 14336]
MAGSVFDSQVYGDLFGSGEASRLFSDSAEVRAMLLVEGALAKAQGAAGVIPQESAAAISRAVVEIAIDPGVLKRPTGQNGVPVPGLVAAFRDEMKAPEHAQYVHWGATSQDIMDSALMLRLRQVLALVETDLSASVKALGTFSKTHAELPMAARTYGQHATPTSFGAVAAGWGAPLLGLLEELPGLRQSCLLVSLAGAAGTSSALGPQAAEVRAAMAKGLALGDPGRSWHTDRTPFLRIADWLVRVTLAFGKLGEDCTALAQSGVGEILLGGAGASSTMPQKQNPVAPSVLTALARQGIGLFSVLQGASMQQHQRDGAAWFTEWMCLPQIVLGAASAAKTGRALCAGLAPNAAAMASALSDGLGMIHAEALSFALAADMPRPDAQAAVKTLCQEAQSTQTPLQDLVAREYPDLDAAALFDASQQMGRAPWDALQFAKKAGELGGE